MTTYGTVTDYKTGSAIREATPAEWRKTADRLGQPGDGYTGTWEDPEKDGRVVYVSGGPDADIHPADIAALADEAGAHGDYEMRRLCREALDGDDTSNPAWDRCREVILDTRMNAQEK
jgi:hypothetical protein